MMEEEGEDMRLGRQVVGVRADLTFCIISCFYILILIICVEKNEAIMTYSSINL